MRRLFELDERRAGAHAACAPLSAPALPPASLAAAAISASLTASALAAAAIAAALLGQRGGAREGEKDHHPGEPFAATHDQLPTTGDDRLNLNRAPVMLAAQCFSSVSIDRAGQGVQGSNREK